MNRTAAAPAHAAARPAVAPGPQAGSRAPDSSPAGSLWPRMAMRSAPAPRAGQRLTVSDPHDATEREASHLSHRLTGRPEAAPQAAPCACHGTCPRCRASGKRKQVSGAVVEQATRSGGQPLSPAERESFEPRLGYDLSPVRVHSGTDANLSARSVSALAFTYGHDIVMSDRVVPGTAQHHQILAHELVHATRHAGDDALHRIPDESGVNETPPRYSYSTNCGWIDWSHADPGMTMQLIQAVQDASDRMAAGGSTTPESVDAPQMTAHAPYVGILLSGVTPVAHIKRPLSKDEVLSVSLQLFMLQSLGFEALQAWTDGAGHSSYSEEDLPSNMLAFYMGARGFTRARIERTCDVWDAARTLTEFQGHTFVRNHTFRPLSLPSGGSWPADLNTITPAVTNGPLMDSPDAVFETTGGTFTRSLEGYELINSGRLHIDSLSGSGAVDISGTTPGSAHGPHFQVNPLPNVLGMVCRWIIQLPDDSRVQMKGDDESSVFQWTDQFNAYINAPSREVLRQQNITSANILCRVRVAASGAAMLERLLTLPVTFNW
ncbi:MAG: DUF4157 domain-containing protein [Acidobacteria bacterium]|nr:DUF4157 domain-containing protein [Acidobacteriota bacterium]